jgi:hypothetical protein
MTDEHDKTIRDQDRARIIQELGQLPKDAEGNIEWEDVTNAVLGHDDEDDEDGLSPMEKVARMSTDDVNAHWPEVSEILATNGEPPAPDVPLSWEVLRTMDEAEHVRRREEVDAFLARGW